MTKSYSLDLRYRVVGSIAGGLSCRGAAKRFAIAPSTAIRYQQRMKATSCVDPFKRGRPSGSGKLAPYRGMLIAKVEERPDITMPELASFLLEQTGVSVTPSNLSKLLCKAGYTYKKTTDGMRTRTQ